MIASAITYAILAISGLIGSGIAMDEMRKANHPNSSQGKTVVPDSNTQHAD